MGKWISSLATALILLALTSLLGALLKGPIDHLGNQGRLSGEVLFAPWMPKPSLGDSEDNESSENVEELSQAQADLNAIVERVRYRNASIAEFGVARMNIENSGSDTVTDISIRVATRFGDSDIVIIDEDGGVEILNDSSRIQLPDMKPGDRATVFVWGNFSEYNAEDAFQTYSSEGQFRISYEWPEVQDFEYRSSIGRFLDEYAWIAFVIFGLMFVALVSIILGIYQEYVKGLMVSPNLREQEARKFLENPKEFQIDYEAAQAAMNVHKGMMKDVADEEGSTQQQGEQSPEASEDAG